MSDVRLFDLLHNHQEWQQHQLELRHPKPLRGRVHIDIIGVFYKLSGMFSPPCSRLACWVPWLDSMYDLLSTMLQQRHLAIQIHRYARPMLLVRCKRSISQDLRQSTMWSRNVMICSNEFAHSTTKWEKMPGRRSTFGFSISQSRRPERLTGTEKCCPSSRWVS